MSIIQEVNEYELKPELLREAMEAVAETDPADRDTFEAHMLAVNNTIRSHGIRMGEGADAAIAIHFRISALARILKGGGARGFQHPTPEPGKISIAEAVVYCAATQPLLDQDGPVSFDEEKFNRCVLTNAAVRGQA